MNRRTVEVGDEPARGLPVLRTGSVQDISGAGADPDSIEVEVHVLSERRMTDWVGIRLAIAGLVRSSFGVAVIAIAAIAAIMLVQGSSVLSGR